MSVDPLAELRGLCTPVLPGFARRRVCIPAWAWAALWWLHGFLVGASLLAILARAR